MATADTTSSSRTSAQPNQSTSLFGVLWQKWLRKRRRDHVRHLSHIRFRMTREGYHFVGILAFIFIGAVIREISLLVLLAGVMIGLLLLQWRFNTSTLIGLQVKRRLVGTSSVDKPTEVEVRLRNPKRWLGAWLVLIEDPLQKIAPAGRRLSDRGAGLIDAVKPSSTAECRYQLTFHERGLFRVGPSTISTRFPLGLGRGWKTVDNASEILVHPKQGQLSARITELLQHDRFGQASASTHAGAHEGEFFGLRPWASGDSRRWIHWRTTARLGALSVRQFEQRQQQQICVLLDLFDTRLPDAIESSEKAISFLATLASGAIKNGRNKISIAVAGAETDIFTAVQSPVLVDNVLDRLAVAKTSLEPDLISAVRGLSTAMLSNPYLLVVSTREDQSKQLLDAAADSISRRLFGRVRTHWLNVDGGDLEPYFASN